MSEVVNWSNDIDYDTVWFVVGQITNQISAAGLKSLEEKLQDEGLEVTGELRRSLFKEVRQNNTSWLTEMAMQFEMYGRFKDMRELRYSKMPDPDGMKSLKDWAQNIIEGKGFQSSRRRPFTFVSGRKNGSFPVDKEQAARQIAWAIARSRLYQPVLRNGRGWYIRNYMKEIYGQIETNIQAAAAQATKNTMKKALEGRK